MAATNFAYIFTTNGDSTAPVLNMVWPQPGTHVSGDSLTVQAHTDDDTAAVALQYTDADAILQTISGQMERGGNVWVSDVPLSPGTNYLSLAATDAAGNVSTTNFSVIQSNVALTVYPLSQDVMAYAYATVAVTVDDLNCTNVTVNGAQGTMRYEGYWEVEDVPLSPGGTVVLQATAQLASGGTVEALLKQERDAIVFTQRFGYKLDYSQGLSFTGSTNGFQTHHIEFQWARGSGGTNLYTSSSVDFSTGDVSSKVTVTVWPADSGYLPRLQGQQVYDYYSNGELMGSSTNIVAAPSVEWMETSTSAGAWPESYGLSWTELSDREVRLFTGGDAARGRQGLFDLSASMSRESEVNSDVPDWDILYQGFSRFLQPANPAVAVPPQHISLGALGKLGNDGHRWTVQPSSKETIITPKAPATSYTASYTGLLPSVVKHKLRIAANGWPLATYRVALHAKFCVGQKSNLTSYMTPAIDDQVEKLDVEWSLPNVFVNYIESWPEDAKKYLTDWNLLFQQNTFAWWVTGGEKHPRCNWTIVFKNGQSAIVATNGRMGMHRPAFGQLIPHPPFYPAMNTILGFLALTVGDMNQNGCMDYESSIRSDFPGSANTTQLISREYHRDLIPFNSSTDGYVLDTTEWYNDNAAAVWPNIPESFLPRFIDGPGELTGRTYIAIEESFQDYVRFKPSGADSLWITIARIDWSWVGSATSDNGWVPVSGSVAPPVKFDDSTFPFWLDVISGVGRE